MSVIMPVPKGSKHYEAGVSKYTYRYGYQPIEGCDTLVKACVDESSVRLSEPVIRNKVETYCASVGIPNEYVASDYGY